MPDWRKNRRVQDAAMAVSFACWMFAMSSAVLGLGLVPSAVIAACTLAAGLVAAFKFM